MTHVVTRSCCKEGSCVPVCPADCIRPVPGTPEFARAEMVHIDPQLCIDCGACIRACPVDAIRPEDELSPTTRPFLALNALWFDIGPGAVDRPVRPARAPRPMGLAERLRPHPPRTGDGPVVAVVGSGPAGVFAVEQLLDRNPGCRVVLLDRLPTPWGLVRAGVAPDHQDTKSIGDVLASVVERDGVDVRFGVEVGRDVTHAELARRFDAVVYATGAPLGRSIGLPGEQLAGCTSSADLVRWYNGHPDGRHLHPDLGHERAVVVGNGNVALDVARVLTTDPDLLARTDLADHALAALRGSAVREVLVLGRRPAGQAAFTAGELLGLLAVPGVSVLAELPDELPDEHGPAARFVVDLLAGLPARPRPGDRVVRLVFGTAPVAVLGDQHVTGLSVTSSGGSGPRDLACGLVVLATGSRGVPVPGVPFDDARGTVPHAEGRVLLAPGGPPVPGVYAVGWVKRGASGVIGSNRDCAAETVSSVVADLAAGRTTGGTPSPTALDALLAARGVEVWDRDAVRSLDRAERHRGRVDGRPRRKALDPAEARALVTGGR